MEICEKKIDGLEKKFNNFEEKNNKQYQEFKDLENKFIKLKEEYEQTVKIVLDNKDQIKILFEKLNDTIKNCKEGDDNLLKKIEHFKKYSDDKILELNAKLDLVLNNINGANGKTFDLSGLDEFMKKLVNLEDQFEEFVNKVNVDEIYKQLKYLDEHKADKDYLEKVEETIDNLNKKSQEHQEEIDIIKYRLDGLYQEIVNINNNLLLNENNEKNITNKNNDTNEENETDKKKEKEIKNEDIIDLDLSKYMVKEDFEKYKNDTDMEINKILEEIKNIHDLIENLSTLVKEKIEAEDLNELRDFILSKIDELMNNIMEKFADKNDYNKNMKYFEEQIKKLYSLLNARKEVNDIRNPDNWLLAKKPINGFSCAACESFIGNLKGDKNGFIPWNKLPMRDPGDKVYRLGNGFSKMLNMIKFDNNGNACLIQNNNDLNDSNETEGDNQSNDKYEINIINENQNNKQNKQSRQKRNKSRTLLTNRFQSNSISFIKDRKDNNIKTQNMLYKKGEKKNNYLPKLNKENSAEVLERVKENLLDKPKITKIFKKSYSKFQIKSNS